MWKSVSFLVSTLALATLPLHADSSEEPKEQQSSQIQSQVYPQVQNQYQPSLPQTADKTPQVLQPFTGKIVKNKVRMRLQPNLDGRILKELSREDMVIVVGETDDFYAIQPPAGTKAYIYRTFVLDNVVEGNRVNVRLEPDLESPVIAQLNAGDNVKGSISSVNNKWMEIAPPENLYFYISKDYLEKIGDASMMAKLNKRRDELSHLLDLAYLTSQEEMQKPFEEINLDSAFTTYNKILKEYTDFPNQAAKAKELMTLLQDGYLQKKIAYLEDKTTNAAENWKAKHDILTSEIETQQERLKALEHKLQQEKEASQVVQKAIKEADSYKPGIESHPFSAQVNQETSLQYSTDKMAVWNQLEDSLYQQWRQDHGEGSKDEFYAEQKQQAFKLQGIIEPYTRSVKNKPGDFLLVNQAENRPIAYLYSTSVNLQNKVGHTVTVVAVPRPNNNFAFPAYFVLSLD